MNTDYDQKQDYDHIFDEPTEKLVQEALDFQLIVDDRARKFIENIEIRYTYNPMQILVELFPDFNKSSYRR